MDIQVGSEASIATPAAGYRTLFINTDKGNALYYKLSDGTVEPFVGDASTDMTEIAAAWSAGLTCALNNGAITAAQYQAIVDQGLQITSNVTPDAATGGSTTTVTIGSRTITLQSIEVDDETVGLSLAGVNTHQIVTEFNPAGAATALTYVTTDAAIATVSASGLITGIGAGECAINVIPNSDPSKMVDIAVVVGA